MNRQSLSPSRLGSDLAGVLVARWLSASLMMLLAGLFVAGSFLIRPALAWVACSDRLSVTVSLYGGIRDTAQPSSRGLAETAHEAAVPAYDLQSTPRHTQRSPDGPRIEGSRTYLHTARLRL